MITLCKESEFGRAAAPDDLTALPGFITGIDVAESKTHDIAGIYTLSSVVSCGVASCRRKSVRGLVVALTQGRLTNISRDCVKSHLGAEFELAARSFERNLKDWERRVELAAFKASIPDTRLRISKIRSADQGDWVYKTTRQLLGVDAPQPLRDALRDMISKRSGDLIRARKETSGEAGSRTSEPSPAEQWASATRAEASSPSAEVVAIIDGISVLYPENDIRDLLLLEVVPLLDAVSVLDVTEVPERRLIEHLKQIQTVEERLLRAEDAVVQGRRFLTQTNLAPFRNSLRTSQHVRQFGDLMKALPA